MKLDAKEFKRYKELLMKKKKGTLTDSESKEFDDLTAKKEGANKLEWWNNYPALTKDVANIPFNWLPGTPLVRQLPAGNTVNHSIIFYGIAAVKYIPAIGRSESITAGFNAQMRQLWLDMHRKYRGIGTYQTSDLGIMMLCVLSAFTLIAKFQRIYGALNTYKIMNRNIPQALFEVLDVDPDIANHLADFRYGLNLRISKLAQLCLPKGIAAIESEIVNNTYLFKDSSNPRADVFCFDAKVAYKYDPTTLSSGGCAKGILLKTYANGSTPSGADGFTKDDIFVLLDDYINALLSDDDVAKMCSDLIAAYGPENVLTVGSIPTDYRLEPIEDYERLLQFHNTKFVSDGVGFVADDSIVNNTLATSLRSAGVLALVYQSSDIIYQEFATGTTYVDDGSYVTPVYSNSLATSANRSCPPADSVLIDTWVEKPGEMEVMCGTRFTVCAEREKTVTAGGHAYFTQYISSFGLAVPTDLVMATVNGSSVSNMALEGTGMKENYASAHNDVIAELLHYDWHPIYEIYNIQSGTIKLVGDVDNPTVISDGNLSRIHDLAVYSAFKIPNVTYIQ